jgi:hypothetical protein
MGNRNLSFGHHVREKEGHQIPSLARFHGRMARITKHRTTGPMECLYFDGSKRVEGAGAVVVLISPQGDKLKYVLRISFPQAFNNEAEYEALLHGMRMAKACGATRLKIFEDSDLVVL